MKKLRLYLAMFMIAFTLVFAIFAINVQPTSACQFFDQPVDNPDCSGGGGGGDYCDITPTPIGCAGWCPGWCPW